MEIQRPEPESEDDFQFEAEWERENPAEGIGSFGRAGVHERLGCKWWCVGDGMVVDGGLGEFEVDLGVRSGEL